MCSFCDGSAASSLWGRNSYYINKGFPWEHQCPSAWEGQGFCPTSTVSQYIAVLVLPAESAEIKRRAPIAFGRLWKNTRSWGNTCLLSLDSAKCKTDLILFFPMDTQKDPVCCSKPHLFVSQCSINCILLMAAALTHVSSSLALQKTSRQFMRWAPNCRLNLIYFLLCQLLIQDLCSHTRHRLAWSSSYGNIAGSHEAQRTTPSTPTSYYFYPFQESCFSILCPIFSLLSSRNLIWRQETINSSYL